MEVILSEQCLSLTCMLERGLGYSIQARHSKKGKVRYYSQRSKHSVPYDGHWRFIVLCAELTRNKLYVTDIRVPRCEVQAALKEAGLPLSCARDVRHELNARDILSLSASIASEYHSDIKKGSAL